MAEVAVAAAFGLGAVGLAKQVAAGKPKATAAAPIEGFRRAPDYWRNWVGHPELPQEMYKASLSEVQTSFPRLTESGVWLPPDNDGGYNPALGARSWNPGWRMKHLQNNLPPRKPRMKPMRPGRKGFMPTV